MQKIAAEGVHGEFVIKNKIQVSLSNQPLSGLLINKSFYYGNYLSECLNILLLVVSVTTFVETKIRFHSTFDVNFTW